MLNDIECCCSDKQSVVAAIGTVKSTRSVDLWNGQTTAPTDNLGNIIPSDPGKGDVEVHCQVTTDFDSAGGAATVQAQLVSADDEDLTVNVTVHRQTDAIPELTAIAGYKFKLGRDLPVGITQKWAGFRYLVAGEATTAGNVSAYIGAGTPDLGWHV